MTETKSSQLDKFKEAARQLEADDDPERFKERLAKLVKRKSVGDAGTINSDSPGTQASARGSRSPSNRHSD